jgi:hypothetical protein
MSIDPNDAASEHEAADDASRRAAPERSGEADALWREAGELLSRSRWWRQELVREELLSRTWYGPR